MCYEYIQQQIDRRWYSNKVFQHCYNCSQDQTVLIWWYGGTLRLSLALSLDAPCVLELLSAFQCQKVEETSGWLEKGEAIHSSKHRGEVKYVVQSHGHTFKHACKDPDSSRKTHATIESVVASVLFLRLVQVRQCWDAGGKLNKQTGLEEKETGCYSLKAVAGHRAQTKLKPVLQKKKKNIHRVYSELMSSTEHLQPLAFTPKVKHEVL